MVSIIIPVYNVQDYIFSCLESVVVQTYKGEIECLLIDDCGTDETMKIIENSLQESLFKSSSIHFRIIHHECNKGVAEARNTGIREAKGDWIFFLDSDDSITPNCIEKLYSLTEKYPDVEIVFGGSDCSSWWTYLTDKTLPEYANNPEWIKTAMCDKHTFCTTVWNKLIRKDFILENNLFFDSLRVHEDTLWNFRLSLVVKRIAICTDVIYHYLIRENGLTSNEGKTRQYVSNLLTIWELELQCLKEIPSTPHLVTIIRDIHRNVAHYSKDEKQKIRKLLLLAFNMSSFSVACVVLLSLPLKGIDRIRKWSFVREVIRINYSHIAPQLL